MGSHERIKTVKSLQRSYFDVLGLCCSSEVPLIENILKPLEGVKEVSVIVTTRTVIVVHDNLLISQIQIVKALNQARLEANVRVYGEENYKKKWPSPYAIACGLLLLLSFLKYVYHPLQWLAVGAVAIGIIPITLKVMVSIRNLRIDINILMMIAVIGTLAMNDYLEAGTIVFLFIIAEWLESRAGHKAHAVMSSLVNMAPQKAVMAETGEVVDADEVKLNAVLAIKAGEVIPIDGVVVEGQCEVDEKALTGESFPVAKEKDSIVWAGTINLNGYVCVKTTALAEDCVVAKMAKLVEEAQNSKTATQRLIDKCAKFYTPAVLIISAGFAVIPLALKVHNLNHWFHLALVVLVSACPCALILSTPVATFCALTKAATSGLLIKGGDYLETLAKIKVAAFDKTGTITKGEFVVTDFRSLRDDISLNTLIYWVSSIESKSSHPMAAALVDHARSLKIEPKPENVGEFQNFPGEGIHGNIDGHDIYIGNRKIALRAGCRTVPALEGDKLEGKTIGYIYCGETPAGFFSLSDACRIGVLDAIRELKLMGIETAMLTGDSHAAATHAQEQLDHALEIVRAELLPEDKARTIGEFKKKGPTAMIGDGVNDAPALATADIGISMGISGSALATETGQVILMSNDLRKIPEAIQLAKKAHRKVVVNILLSITTKSAILALAFAGHPLVWAAVLADVGTCLLVIFNSMLLLRGTQKHRGTCNKSSSTAKHTHKHGCNATHSSSSHHHHSQEKHHNCCSDKKAQIVSQPQKCSSMECAAKCKSIRLNSNSCGTNKCMDSAASHDKCVSSEHHEANHCLELHEGKNECRSVPQNLGSCTKEECKNLIESQGDCVKGDRLHVAQHCNHSTPSEGRQNITNDGHCHSNHSGKNHTDNEASGTTVVSCCHHPQQMQEIHHELHECCKNHNAPLQTTVDIDYVESTSTNAMEKRETDDCCKGHRKHLERQNIPNDGHCHSNHCGKNHTDNGASGKTAVSSCHHQQQMREIHPNLHECCKDNNAPLHTTIDIDRVESTTTNAMEKREMGGCCNGHRKEHEESAAMHACLSLEKRQIGGCCKSYMEECCGKHGHIAANFGGGLSEIVTES